jgi:hypothetical protein
VSVSRAAGPRVPVVSPLHRQCKPCNATCAVVLVLTDRCDDPLPLHDQRYRVGSRPTGQFKRRYVPGTNRMVSAPVGTIIEHEYCVCIAGLHL